jgi:hypothetical protein
MRHLVILAVDLISTVLRLVRPGGVRAIVAESVLAKHQLLIPNRSRRRAPSFCILDRLIVGFCSFWIKPSQFHRVAIAFRRSTLLNFIAFWYSANIGCCSRQSRKLGPGHTAPQLI